MYTLPKESFVVHHASRGTAIMASAAATPVATTAWVLCDAPSIDERFAYIHDFFMEKIRMIKSRERTITEHEEDELHLILAELISLQREQHEAK